ncbi:MAG: electron transporter SenC [Chloroflexota bacterium]|nr:MAG: electron transporter SenC [Chloroflexota bacterium]
MGFPSERQLPSAQPPRRVGGSLAVVAALLVLTGCVAAPDGTENRSLPPGDDPTAFEPAVYDPPSPAPTLDGLVDSAGRRFSLDDLRGRVVLVSFGYTHCPDVCPTTLAVAREVLRARPDAARVVFVTVDPERDTADALAGYLRYFEAPIVGLTGDPATVEAVARAWGVTVVFGERDAVGNYPVIHSAGTYVVDGDGRLRLLYPYGTPADVLVAAVDRLTAEP